METYKKFEYVVNERKKESNKNISKFRNNFRRKFRNIKVKNDLNDLKLNIEHYITNFKRNDGIVKENPEDFIVEEILENRMVLGANESLKNQIVDEEIPEEFKDVERWNGSFLHFTVEKVNYNTIDVIKDLARLTKTKRKNFGFAGTKDKYALTTQRMGCFGIKPEVLEAVGKNGLVEKRGGQFIIRDVCKSNKKLRMGNLWGNRFSIKIRDVEEEGESYDAKNLSLDYVINYFGVQRFGLQRPITHLVGKHIYERDFETAFYIYCGTPINEKGLKKEAREAVEDGDFKLALKLFPRESEYEKRLIQQYLKYKDYKKAFYAFAPQLRSLFVNSYQSYLFNEILNKRYEYGYGALEGDILEDGVPTAPLCGYKTEYSKGIAGEIEKEVFEKYSIDFKKFRIEDYGNFSGLRRKMITPVYNFKIEKIYEKLNNNNNSENLNSKEKAILKLSFELEKGNYATIVTREFTGKLS
ncbi:tRNA pseudouridine(13) synthase TruD [Methanococcus voltae]|uniref:Probable tRNA pseudouridine synthase D n=1 Tax=Methanococcus voltae (strain ATCC BAA-1334 / A3) TaxID=456320 RepID=D7DRS2_METV3|nr:tRNA pseudouridine(13) synthase TruD [Methanococcus voltae]MCS3901150.1 tRNA pseudouridine13 synthase [Methanococcus voltae]